MMVKRITKAELELKLKKQQSNHARIVVILVLVCALFTLVDMHLARERNELLRENHNARILVNNLEADAQRDGRQLLLYNALKDNLCNAGAGEYCNPRISHISFYTCNSTGVLNCNKFGSGEFCVMKTCDDSLASNAGLIFYEGTQKIVPYESPDAGRR